MQIEIVLIAAVAALAWHLHRRRKPKGWRITYSKGMPPAPTITATGWRVEVRDGQELHAVETTAVPPLHYGQTVMLTLAVEGSFVAWEYPDQPPLATLLIEGEGADSSERTFDRRWYSTAAIPLVPGQHTIEVPLTVEHMGDTMGGRDEAALRDCLAHPKSWSVVFGTHGGRGHGVYSTAPGSIELLGLG